MVFSSIIFLFLFLPVFLLIYFATPRKLKNTVLLMASLLFYFWGEGRYVIVMLIYMVFNWAFGLIIQRHQQQNSNTWARFFFVGSIVFNLGFLVFYKYFNFIIDNINSIVVFSKNPISINKIHLPIGISFFTFQALSYVIDVYKGQVKAQKNLVDFSMYKALFPQLIAGPIVRYRDVASQINERLVTYRHFTEGIERFIIGLAKKVLIANNMAIVADQAFGLSSHDLTAPMAWLGAVCYALQIYFDFSGYSDMAIGLGKMLGFDFLENFNYPYIAKSIKEFWRRWHISLSSWFRDYVYIPLGGSKAGKYRTYFNLLTVFFLCGLWHGASWTFVFWGLWHGLFLVLERTPWGCWLAKLHNGFRYAYSIVVVLIGWVFFRADYLSQAFDFLQAMGGVNGWNTAWVSTVVTPKFLLWFALGLVFSTSIYQSVHKRILATYERVPLIRKIGSSAYVILLFSMFIYCATVLSSNTYNPFIYFRF